MSNTCELCYGKILDYENLYNVGYGLREEWVCEQCFMDFAKEEYPEICEGYEYKTVYPENSFEDFIIDHKIDDLKGGDF